MIKKLFLAIAILILTASAGRAQNILWMGGEDLDFPNGQSVSVDTTSGHFRSGYAREAIQCSNPNPAGIGFTNPSVSTVFPGGAVTSLWLTAQIYGGNNTASPVIGVGTSGTLKALWIAASSSSATKLALYKSDGTTNTSLATETGFSIVSTGLWRVDMHVASYGAAATVTVYVNQSATPVITFTGDVTAGGSTNVNAVFLGSLASQRGQASEIVVSDSDTRAMSLVTLYPNGAGTTNTWTSGTYTNINPAAINDASVISSATTAQDFEANLLDLPTGSFSIPAVKIVARSVTNPSGLATMKVGVFTNSSISVPAASTMQLYWFPFETYYATNPVTAVPWTMSDINALQINLRSQP